MEQTNFRFLGKSDLHLSPVGLGCWQFSKQNNFAGKFWPKLEDDLIRNIVSQSLQHGINWFDTAELYGKGASEKALSHALTELGKKPGEVIVATKWWPMFRTASNILKTITDRIEALSPFPIDLYQVHHPYGFSSEKEEMKAMAELVRSGKIRYIGVSNFSASKLRSAWETLDKLGIPLVSNQVRYSLLDRSIESNGILQTAKELGISIIAYSPLAQGMVTGKFHKHPEAIKASGYRRYSSIFKRSALEKSLPLITLLRELAEKYKVSVSQVALNWMIHFHGENIFVIPGATKEAQACDNPGSMSFRMTAEDMERVNQESKLYK